MATDHLAALAAKLTINGAINLHSTITDPCPLNPDAIHGKGTIFTGLGKWTTLAAIGVERHLVSIGAAEWHMRSDGRTRVVRITPLGRELAAYLAAHWEDLRGTFRDPKWER